MPKTNNRCKGGKIDMENGNRVRDAVIELIAVVKEKTAVEISANLDASFEKDYQFTSLEYFPLLSGLEEKFDIELDYAAFLTDIHTIREAIDFVAKAID